MTGPGATHGMQEGEMTATMTFNTDHLVTERRASNDALQKTKKNPDLTVKPKAKRSYDELSNSDEDVLPSKKRRFASPVSPSVSHPMTDAMENADYSGCYHDDIINEIMARTPDRIARKQVVKVDQIQDALFDVEVNKYHGGVANGAKRRPFPRYNNRGLIAARKATLISIVSPSQPGYRGRCSEWRGFWRAR